MPEDSASTARGETRRLAAIMFADIVGFSRQMGADEARMLRLLDLHNQIIQQVVAEHQGRIMKSTGDGFLIEFASAVRAVQCAQQLQAQLRAYNTEQEPAQQFFPVLSRTIGYRKPGLFLWGGALQESHLGGRSYSMIAPAVLVLDILGYSQCQPFGGLI